MAGKIRTSYEKHPFIWAVVFNLAVLCVLMLVFYPTFETNDDFGINRLIDGSRGSGNAYMAHCNIVMGAILRLFYQITASIPWYTLFQYLILYFSFVFVTYVLFDLLPLKNGIFTAVLIAVFFGYEGFINIQYTKTSGIASAAGFLLLVYALYKKQGKVLPACGVILTAFGVMYRFGQGLACLLLCLGCALFILVLEGRAYLTFSSLKKYIQWGVVLCAVFAVLAVSDKAYIRANETWSSWKEFDAARTDLLDYEVPDYEQYQDEYEKIGFTRSAYDAFTSWNFADPDVISTDKLQQIGRLTKKQPMFTAEKIKAFFTEIPPAVFSITVLYPVLILLLLALFSEHKKSAIIVSILYVIILYGGLNYYLFSTGRYLVHRVDVGLLFAMACVFILMQTKKSIRPLPLAAAAVLIVLSFAVTKPELHVRRTQGHYFILNRMNKEHSCIELCTSDPEHLYLLKLNTLSDSDAYGVFHGPLKGELNNLIYLGGWDVYTPVYNEALAGWNIRNPYRDAIDRDDVLILDNDPGLTQDFYRDYYGKNIYLDPYKEVAGFTAFHVKSL